MAMERPSLDQHVRNTIERRETWRSPEQLTAAPEVMIFLRHDEKEAQDPDGGKDDKRIELTNDGVRNAIGDRRTQWEALLNGRNVRTRYSGRVRAGQTATAVAARKNEDGYLESPLREGYITADGRLDFDLGGTPADKMMLEAYKNGRLLEWIVQESDVVGAQEGNEAYELTYKKQSGKIAQMILEDLRAEHDRDAVVVGSHQSITEAFLARVVEEVGGVDVRDQLIAALGDGKQGFGFSEGYAVGLYPDRNEVTIFYQSDSVNEDGEPKFTFHETISRDILEKIAQDAPDPVNATEVAAS